MDLGISNKNILITGASQGLGRAISLAFAKEGCRVAVIARREDKLKELVLEMGGEKKGHNFIAANLLDENQPLQAMRVLEEKMGGFDIVVHNVGGTMGIRDSLASVSDWMKVWQLNVGIAIQINNHVIPKMQKQKWGRIIHISSISGESLRGSVPYAVAKACLTAYSTVLGRTVAPDGIVVSVLMPGAFAYKGSYWDTIKDTNPAMLKDFLRHHQAIGRLGSPEEIIPFVLFMASKHVTFATATVIPIDGGTM